MKVRRQARIVISHRPPQGGAGLGPALLATELLEALNRLIPTLPADAIVEPKLQSEDQCMGAACALAFSWEEDL